MAVSFFRFVEIAGGGIGIQSTYAANSSQIWLDFGSQVVANNQFAFYMNATFKLI